MISQSVGDSLSPSSYSIVSSSRYYFRIIFLTKLETWET